MPKVLAYREPGGGIDGGVSIRTEKIRARPAGIKRVPNTLQNHLRASVVESAHQKSLRTSQTTLTSSARTIAPQTALCEMLVSLLSASSTSGNVHFV